MIRPRSVRSAPGYVGFVGASDDAQTSVGQHRLLVVTQGEGFRSRGIFGMCELWRSMRPVPVHTSPYAKPLDAGKSAGYGALLLADFGSCRAALSAPVWR